jgi:hypothetical protein
MKYYFTGTEIVEVEYDSTIDNSDPQSDSSYRDTTSVYRNVVTNKYYFINKGVKQHKFDPTEGGEIFEDRNELIEFKIKELENEVVLLNDKILFLKNNRG